ncbi:MAG: hypothetical protein AAFV45_15420 [Pseudomonadota bacterium]
MAQLRFKIELNPGGQGVRLDKLSKLSGEIEKFLRHLASDSGAKTEIGDWIAKDFYNKSVGAVVEYVGIVEPPVVNKFKGGVRFFSTFNRDRASSIGRYSQKTLKQFVEIGEALDTDEKFRIGLFDEDADSDIEWQDVTKQTTLVVEDIIREEVLWDGSVQGVMGTWYKQSSYFNLKEVVGGETIKCHYVSRLYEQVHRMFSNKDAVVMASGTITSNRTTGRIKEMKISDLQEFAALSDDEFDFLLRGVLERKPGKDTSEVIEKRRDNDDA